MHACFRLGLSAVQTSEPTSKTRGDAVMMVRNISYSISYRDNWDTYCIMKKLLHGPTPSSQP